MISVIKLKLYIIKKIKNELANTKKSIIYERRPRNWLKRAKHNTVSSQNTEKNHLYHYFLSHEPVDLFLKEPLGQRLRFVFFFMDASIVFISALTLRFFSVYFFLYFLAMSLRDLHCLMMSLHLIPLISCWTCESLSLIVLSEAKSDFNACFRI